MESLGILLVFGIWAIINVVIANARGVRNPGYAFLWSLLTPIAGLIYALVAKSERQLKRENVNRIYNNN